MSEISRVEGLCKEYQDGAGGTLRILDGVDFSFVKGRSTSIVGKSGSGKSTLLQLLGGLDRPTSGKILFGEEDINQFSSAKLSQWRNQHIGFVFQAHHLLPDFSALENVMIPAIIAGSSQNDCKARAEQLLDQVDLQGRKHHKPGQLSGGEQQRVAIARALINNPALILADEPTGNLDAQTGEVVAALLQQICIQQGSTLIIVTHNPQFAASMDCQLQLVDKSLIQLQ